ncbi:MAG: hypothetical protein NT092_07055 [Bacteroidia bacterium]|nr:hypothetical protein [Bacteroidia bacterium]
MNSLSIRKILVLSLIFSLTATVCEARTFDKSIMPEQQKSASGLNSKQKKSKAARPKSVKKVQKEADKKDKKLKKDSKKAVGEFQKHALEIQTPEVRERIKQNRKNSDSNYKAKRKNNAAKSKKAGRRYN